MINLYSGRECPEIEVREEYRQEADPRKRFVVRIPPTLDVPDRFSQLSPRGAGVAVDVSSDDVTERVA